MTIPTPQPVKIKARNRKPGAPKKPLDPRIARSGEQIGGGFFVFRRGRKIGRVQCPEWPFEHPTMEAAHAEAERLRAKYPGERFDVFSYVWEAQE